MKLFYLLPFFLLFLACNNDDDSTDSPDTNKVMYRLDFEYTWSATTHPTNYPSSAHFSPLIGTTHKEDVTLWASGELASEGIEVMAETGGTSTLSAEIKALENVGDVIKSPSVPEDSPGSHTITFSVDQDKPYVSVVSMLAPSPDWFVGVNGLKLTDENGAWLDEVVVDLKVYDSGTDDGEGFTSPNSDSNPKQVISLLTSDSSDTDFSDGEPVIGSFTFTKI